MNINQIYSNFPLVYPDRLIGDSLSLNKKRRLFRDLSSKFKLNIQKRLIVLNPYKENNDKGEEQWYKIPYTTEKDLIISNFHWNYNHCGRDAVIEYIKKEGWYWYGFFKDVENIIKACPQCDNGHNKFKKFKPKIKNIIDNGAHYRYITDLWYLSKNISAKTGYSYILDIVDHFSKWYQGYCLKTKSAEEVLFCIDSFIQSFGKPHILQADNGLEFSNNDINNYCINNEIKLIHGRVRHPQSQGACEACHKEIKKYIYNKYLEDEENFNLLKTVREITNIHNNKKHSSTEECPKDIKDLTDEAQVKIIQDRMKLVISRKNKNKDNINFDDYYVISSDLVIKNNKLTKSNKYKKNSKNTKVPISILSLTNNENVFLIEIAKSVGRFKEGESYTINADLLEVTNEHIWKEL